jgi:small multidrug resistance family-3 protein
MIFLIYYISVVLAEIVGCFSFWAWLRLGKAIYWVFPRIVSLITFAWPY